MVKPLLKLPILRNSKSNKLKYPEWHTYYKNVYKSPVTTPVDLNLFNWFYWNSPLGNVKCKIIYSIGNIVDVNVPYIFNVLWPEQQGIGIAPENNLANIGFFVRRNNEIPRTAFLEVMRTNKSVYEEKGICWFFLTIGSGFFLKCDSVTITKWGCNIVEKLNKSKAGREDNTYFFMCEKKLHNLVLFHDYEKSGTYIVMHKLKTTDTIANTADLPLFRGGIPYKHKYHPKTHCMY